MRADYKRSHCLKCLEKMFGYRLNKSKDSVSLCDNRLCSRYGLVSIYVADALCIGSLYPDGTLIKRKV